MGVESITRLELLGKFIERASLMDNAAHVFVVQHQNERFDAMPFSIALDWRRTHGLDIVIYAMYDAVGLLKDDFLRDNDELRSTVDALLQEGASIYACGFCSRACQLNAETYYPGVQVANRSIFFELMKTRKPLYW